MKKVFNKLGLVVFLLIILFSVFDRVEAMPVPFLNVKVIVNSVGGNDEFNYDLSSPIDGYQKFKIQTQTGLGSSSIITLVNNQDIVYLTQSSSSLWQLSNATCTSTNSQIIIEPYTNGVKITAYPFSSITCTFTNTKVQKKTPVIIVPGVMGTEMKNGNESLWLDLGRMFTDIGDSFMDPLSFTTNLEPTDLNALFSSVIFSKNILFFTFDYTSGIINDFKFQGYTEGTSSDVTLFTFPYDWRYGVSGIFPDGKTNADLLKQKIQEVMNQTGSDKVDVIAHSMGGLIVKKYAMDNPTEHYIDKAVFVGVPNLGAPKAIKVLLQGDNMGIPWLAESEIKKISQNMPVSYDLMPSKNYTDQNGPFINVVDGSLAAGYRGLDYSQTRDFLINNEGLNQVAYDNSQSLDNSLNGYDIRSAGVNLYNIVGCRGGTLGLTTLGTFLESSADDSTTMSFLPALITGDGTVPAVSSASIKTDNGKTFYALEADHSKMLSQNGTRQEIANLLSGSNLNVDSELITQDNSECRLDGNFIEVHSPIDIEVIDKNGNRAGISSDGSIQNDIINADYELWGDQKYLYLPKNNTYTIKVRGTAAGSYTIRNSSISNNQIVKTEVFSNLPVTSELAGNINIADTTTLTIQSTPTSTPQTINPSSILDTQESQDLLPPISTSTIVGTQGEYGFYRSDVEIVLNATDTVGILNTQYNLDNQGYKTYSSSTKILISEEGFHTISFFSTDRAGNNEEPKTVSFIADKTAPEFVIKFDPSIKDFKFSGTDNISTSSMTILDKDDVVSVTDQAGNKTEIKFKNKNRKSLMMAEIKSISYNGISTDISKNSMDFLWKIDKKKNLTFLSQHISSKKGYNILALYNGKSTNLIGKDSTGIIFKTIKGLQILKISTNKGDLGWNY